MITFANLALRSFVSDLDLQDDFVILHTSRSPSTAVVVRCADIVLKERCMPKSGRWVRFVGRVTTAGTALAHDRQSLD